MMVYNCAKFQNHRAFRKRFTEGGRNPPPPAVLGFKKPGLFRVKLLPRVSIITCKGNNLAVNSE